MTLQVTVPALSVVHRHDWCLDYTHPKVSYESVVPLENPLHAFGCWQTNCGIY
jgi:hypothetical protein